MGVWVAIAIVFWTPFRNAETAGQGHGALLDAFDALSHRPWHRQFAAERAGATIEDGVRCPHRGVGNERRNNATE
ncbi:hypothetical protein IQ254_07565 [Nodosilinea sp. LEGE 07088]|uniref:hypothetical protein n=1 Tax=Nodosilinea sp. LEGE 07088 TaxID=2777968 RepID=UPI00187E26A3|nr:hypothetical protein [Nodosilinea sp. LEGE 07088]MBE9137059.1 hypothetical protein [Nodosilinea sp. LEGE 07088]